MLSLVLSTCLLVPCPGPQSSRPARRAITGEVLDTAGKPAAGAQARLWRWSGETLPENFARGGTRISELVAVPVDAEGRFRMEAEDGRFYVVSADRGEERAEPEVFVPAGARLVLRLLAPVTVAGRVQRKRDDAITPVPGARIRIIFSSDRPTGAWQNWKRPRAEPVEQTTDAEGRFSVRLPGLGQGATYLIWARAPVDGEEWLVSERTTGAAECILQLAAPIEQEKRQGKERVVQFVDKASGAPVAGVRVVGWGSEHARESDAEGRVKVPVQSSNHVVPRRHARTAIPYEQDPAAELKIELVPGRSCKARLLREDGRPLADALVVLGGPVSRENTTWHHLAWDARTDKDGLLELPCLQPDMTVFGFVEVDGAFAPFLHITPKKDVDLGDVRIALTGRLAGRVLGPDGGPVADARLLLQTAGDGKGTESQHLSRPSRAARSGAAGTFTISALLPGKYRMAAVARGLKPEFKDVVVGGPAAPVEFTLTRGETVRGKVLQADGKPAAHVSLYCWMSNPGGDELRFGIQPTTETDKEGCFVLGGLPTEGAVNLSVNLRVGDGWQNGQAQGVQVGTQDVEITLSAQ